MVRTQIYLTDEEKQGLDSVAKSTGKKQSELIRTAIDTFLDQSRGGHRATVLKEAAGLWGTRTDFPDFRNARRSWDRE